MNPNVCTICETMFERVMKARQVELDATILFADLRGYTSLSQSRSSGAIAKLLDAFYDVCGEAIWEHDGIINKTMGDAVLAIKLLPRALSWIRLRAWFGLAFYRERNAAR